MDEDFLEHFGVKGMKWGVKRAENRVKVANSSDHNETRAIMKKSVSAMSNAELQKANTRRQLETTYSQLNPAAITRGQKFANNALAIGKTTGKVIDAGKTAFDVYQTVSSNPLLKDLIKQTR